MEADEVTWESAERHRIVLNTTFMKNISHSMARKSRQRLRVWGGQLGQNIGISFESRVTKKEVRRHNDVAYCWKKESKLLERIVIQLGSEHRHSLHVMYILRLIL